MANKVAGTVFLKVDGVQISIAGSISLDMFSIEREGMSGLSGVVGYKENNRVPSIECEAFVTDKTDLEAIQKAEDVTVTAELSNGQVGTLRNSWLATAPVIDGAEGKVTLKWEGLKGDLTKGAAA